MILYVTLKVSHLLTSLASLVLVVQGKFLAVLATFPVLLIMSWYQRRMRGRRVQGGN